MVSMGVWINQIDFNIEKVIEKCDALNLSNVSNSQRPIWLHPIWINVKVGEKDADLKLSHLKETVVRKLRDYS